MNLHSLGLPYLSLLLCSPADLLAQIGVRNNTALGHCPNYIRLRPGSTAAETGTETGSGKFASHPRLLYCPSPSRHLSFALPHISPLPPKTIAPSLPIQGFIYTLRSCSRCLTLGPHSTNSPFFLSSPYQRASRVAFSIHARRGQPHHHRALPSPIRPGDDKTHPTPPR